MQPDLSWLNQCVPLYALLVALVTTPFLWSDKAVALVRRLFEGRGGNGGAGGAAAAGPAPA